MKLLETTCISFSIRIFQVSLSVILQSDTPDALDIVIVNLARIRRQNELDKRMALAEEYR